MEHKSSEDSYEHFGFVVYKCKLYFLSFNSYHPIKKSIRFNLICVEPCKHQSS